jgi:hypothetical protein
VTLSNGAALCVGVSKYNDRALAPLPDAGTTAREIQKALEPHLFPASGAIIDPGSNGDLFLRLQKAAGEARGGIFVLYFAGHALRRGGDLLLSTRDTELEGAKGCVPWSDVHSMLRRERVSGGLVLLNVDQPAGLGPPQLGGGTLCILASLRTYDADTGNASLRGYADAILAALQKPVGELESFLKDGALDASGLHRYLSDRAPPKALHSTFSMPARSAVLRDFAGAALSRRGSALPPAPAPAASPPPPAPAAPAIAALAPEPVVAAEPAAEPEKAVVQELAPEPEVKPEPAVKPEAVVAPEPEIAKAAPAPADAEAVKEEEPVSEPVPAKALVEVVARTAEPAAALAPVRGGTKVSYAVLAAAVLVAAVVYALLRS